jgi:murein DD-endopeptidase MepM/ murein hydrolase activator NlpD
MRVKKRLGAPPQLKKEGSVAGSAGKAVQDFVSAAGGRVRALADKLFPEREIYLRAHGEVTFIRISQKRQLQLSALLAGLLVWGMTSTAVTLLSTTMIAERDAEIDYQKQEYADLLADVSEYQHQYDRIVEGLEENQSMLLGLLDESAQDNDAQRLIVERNLNHSETERARVVLAREALQERLGQFATELVVVAQKNAALEDQVTSMKTLLEDTRAERAEVDLAREQLIKRLDAVESELASAEIGKKALSEQLGDLSEDLVQSDASKQALIERRIELERQLAELEKHQQNAKDREAELEGVVANLQKRLDESRSNGERVARERDLLLDRVAGLEGKLRSYEQRQLDLIAKMTERTLSSIGDFEQAMKLTGLKLDKMLSRVSGEGEEPGMGGPFVPLDGMDLQGEESFDAALSLLDLHLRRWEGLRQLATVLPLAAPLNAYEVNSTFGPRKDPLKNLKSYHDGLDMGAPTGTEILAPAPGVVTFAGWYGGYGRFIEIDHGFGITTRYGHLKKIEVEKGDRVDFRQLVGTVGSSGRSTGPHLHYEVRLDGRPLDPDNFLEAGRHLFKG